MTGRGVNLPLGDAAARGAAITLLGQMSRVLIQALSLVVLARLLSPEDYGLVALVAVAIGIGEVFRDFGLSQAAIQSPSLSRGQRDNLFWINTAIGTVLAGALIASASGLAGLMGDQRLAPIATSLSAVFVLNGASAQYRADLTRRLMFNRLAMVEVLSPALGLLVALTMAVSGLGYWALVGNQLVVAGTAALMLPALGRWLPGGYARGEAMKDLLSFGGNLLGVQALLYGSRNIDRLIIGSSLGMATLGLYERAQQLFTLPLNQLNAPANRVALPILARLQDDSARYCVFLVRGQAAILHLLTAIFGFSGVHASIIVDIALGERWSAAAPILQAFALAGFAQGAGYVTYWIFLSKGLTRANLHFTLVTRPIMVAAIFFGSFWGAVGVAWGYSVALLLLWPLGIWWAGRVAQTPTRQLLTAGISCLAGYGIAAASSYLVVSLVALPNPYLELLLGSAGFCLGTLLAALVLPRFREDLLSVLKLFPFLFRSRLKGKGERQPDILER